MARRKRIGNAWKLERRAGKAKRDKKRCAGCRRWFGLGDLVEVGVFGEAVTAPASHVFCRRCEAAWIEGQVTRWLGD